MARAGIPLAPLLSLSLLAAAGPAQGAPATATATAAVDGRTLAVVVEDARLRLRLRWIEVPPLGHAAGRRAREALHALAAGRTLALVAPARLGTSRIAARARAGNTDLALAMLRGGHAWIRPGLAPPDRAFATAQREARRARRGVWSAQGSPPWRRYRAPPVIARDRAPHPSAAFLCGRPLACEQLRSCTEALHYFHLCGLAGLDPDGDRVPCERLCRR